MSKQNKSNYEIRLAKHQAFERRTKRVFRFLVTTHKFKLIQVSPDRDLGRYGGRSYLKAHDLVISINCEGYSQYVLLGGVITSFGTMWGLHQLMAVRCPKVAYPRMGNLDGTKAEIEMSLTTNLEAFAEILRTHFNDFLGGDATILKQMIAKMPK